ncbi:hypothetical protein K501DRAFT_174707 [Backusella circina FSU 941]|nr:hypothetical protein K501DRAFT_174707 [Backusella circina FSU 941]
MTNNNIVNHNYSRRSEPKDGFKTLEAFYPFYLGEHANKINRRLHIIGTTLSQILFLLAIIRQQPKFALIGFFQGYTWAWIGHFFFENNKPATFRYPIWSFICDLKLWKEVISGQRAF